MTVELHCDSFNYSDLKVVPNEGVDADGPVNISLFSFPEEENEIINMASRVSQLMDVVEQQHLHQELQHDLTKHLFNVYKPSQRIF